jgi:VTC domain
VNAFERAIGRLEPLSLEELDEQAALRERVDTKYVVPAAVAERVVEGLADRYRALEIDGRRSCSYASVYFDTPDLRCFTDHLEGRRPRFKLRSRYYRDTGACFFEVKVKSADGRMTKRQRPYDHGDHGSITEPARRLLDDTLTELADEPAPPHLAPSLSSSYQRLTLAPKDAASAQRSTWQSGCGPWTTARSSCGRARCSLRPRRTHGEVASTAR